MSAAIYVPAVAIAVPVHSAEDQVAGYWVAIVNLGDIESSLRGIDPGSSESRILLVDHNGTQVADTGRAAQETTELRSFANLQSVRSALSGNAGTIVEEEMVKKWLQALRR